MNQNQTNRLLGYPEDARLLIINADDFGMCHSVNDAVFRAFRQGVLCSTTLMVPCPWALHAMHQLTQHPEIPFGVHLTAIADWRDYPWGPVSPRDNVPSLINEHGYFYDFDHMPELFAHMDLHELETEFRAQIEVVLSTGLKPTHLDWHSLRISNRIDVFRVIFKLARDYGLALRVAGEAAIEFVQAQGLPCNDRHFLDSYGVDPVHKSTEYAKLLHELPEGLNEWALHPALDTPELLAIEIEANHIRQTDYDFLVSPQAKEIIASEGIILLDYRALQNVWREKMMR